MVKLFVLFNKTMLLNLYLMHYTYTVHYNLFVQRYYVELNFLNSNSIFTFFFRLYFSIYGFHVNS